MKAWIALCVSLLVGCSSTCASGDELERIRAWLAASNVSWSYDVDCSLSTKHDGKIVGEQKRRQRFLKGGLWRCDSSDSNSQESAAFDGQQFCDRNESGDFMSYAVSGRASSAMYHRHMFFPHELSHATFSGVAYSEVFADRMSSGVKKNERQYYFPPLAIVRKFVEYSDLGLLIEFEDPACLFPTRIAALDSNGNISFQFRGEYGWTDSKPFPKRVFKETYVNGSVVLVTEMACEVRCLDCEMSPTIFTLEPSIGSVVYSEAEKANYIRTASSEKDYQEYQDLLRGSERGKSTSTRGRWWSFLLLLGLICLFLLPYRMNKHRGEKVVKTGVFLMLVLSSGACNKAVSISGATRQNIGLVQAEAVVEFDLSLEGEDVPIVNVAKSCQCLKLDFPQKLQRGKNRLAMTITGGKGAPSERVAVAFLTLRDQTRIDLLVNYIHGDRVGILPDMLQADDSGHVEGRILVYTGDSKVELEIRCGQTVVYSRKLPSRFGLTEVDFKVPIQLNSALVFSARDNATGERFFECTREIASGQPTLTIHPNTAFLSDVNRNITFFANAKRGRSKGSLSLVVEESPVF